MNLLAPMLAMVVLTLALAPLVFVARVRAVRRGELAQERLRCFDGTGAPDAVTRTTRHLANLFEMPVLFYVACLTALHLQMDGTLLASLGWAYLACRVAHAGIHLTYNRLGHRLAAFMASNVALYLLWILIILRVVRG